MPDYTFAPAPVLVETTGEFAIGAVGVLRATDNGDPVTIYDLNDSPIAGVLVGPKGAHAAFKADISDGVLDFGSVILPTESLEQRRAALEARSLAISASATATTALQLIENFTGPGETPGVVYGSNLSAANLPDGTVLIELNLPEETV